jgi:hypothetical protein
MNKWGVTNSSINQWMRAYFEEYTRLDSNRRPLIYTYPYWAKAISLDSYFAQYQLWIASYQPTPAVPAPWKDWTMWQRSGGTEKLPNGVPVDVNVVRDLSLWDSTPVIVSPPPEPDPIASNQSDSDNGGIELSTHQSVPTTAPSSSSSSSSSSSIFGFLDNLFKR